MARKFKLTNAIIKDCPAPKAGVASGVWRAGKAGVEIEIEAGKDVILWDSDVSGLMCKITPADRRVFMLYYRVKEGPNRGQQRRPAVGLFPGITVEKAREKARKMVGAIADGKDPSAERQVASGAPTLSEFCDRYLKEYAREHKRPSSVAADEQIIDQHLKPKLGSMKLAAINRADVAGLHSGLAKTPYHANRTLALLSKMMNLAEAWGIRPDHSNPCRHIRRFKEKKRERFLSGDELKKIGAALAEAERKHTEERGCILAVRLLALTGCRMGEILSLRWDFIDTKKGVANLPESKTGAKSVALSAPALELLAGMDSTEGYVVTGADAAAPLSPWVLEKAWQRLRMEAGVPDARLHDFRHTVGTYGGQAGFNAFIVRDLLGHKTLAMTGRYVERDTNPVRIAADAVGNRIAAAMAGKKAETKPLRPKSRRQSRG